MPRTFGVMTVREQFPAQEREHNERRAVYLDGPRVAPRSRSSLSRRSPAT
jgi:selenocysteine lyase/cysteine desulfurase